MPADAEPAADVADLLRAAVERRRAAGESGQPRRRRRAADDEDEADAGDAPDATTTAPPAGAEDPVPVGWVGAGPDPDPAGVGAVGRPAALGWPEAEPGAAPSGSAPPAAGPSVAVSPAVAPGGPRPSVAPASGPGRPAASAVPVPAKGTHPEAAPRPPVVARPPAPAPDGPRPTPATGWRRLLYVLTGGALNLGESGAERERRERRHALSGSTAGCYRIAVISLKGGVGKTTMSVCLGAVLASLRPDRVIAVDANPDRGTLAGKVTAQTTATVRDLLEALPRIGSYADVRGFTSQTPDRLEILASAADPAQSDAFSEADYRRVVACLQDYYNIVVTDCGTGLLHSAMSGVLDLADQLVVISTNSVDGANSASATLDWLQAHGHADLVRGAVAVINAVVPGSNLVDQERLAEHFAGRCRAVVRIPHDVHLEAGAEVELDALGMPTRDALLGLAESVVGAIPRR